MTPEAIDKKLEEILDDYAQQYSQLLKTPTMQAREIKDKKRAEAIKQIEQYFLDERWSKLDEN